MDAPNESGNKRDVAIGNLMRDGTELNRRGDHRAAEVVFRQIVELDERHVPALNAIGLIALRSQRADAADWFQRAVEVDPTASPLWINLASAARAVGNSGEEARALHAVLAMDQQHMVANVRMAELLDRQGDEAGAVQRWQGVATMLSAIDNLSPQGESLLEQARARITAFGEKLQDAIDAHVYPLVSDLTVSQRRRFDACVDSLSGRRRIYVNECHGLTYPFLPADEFFDREHFPRLAELEAETGAIRAEFLALFQSDDAGFEPYVQMPAGTPDSLWSSLNGSSRWSTRHLWRHGERDDAMCDRCPRTAAALAAFQEAHVSGRMPTAFFSVLKPHTHLPAHTGTSNIRAIVHLPLIVPPGCRFRVGGETRSWVPGTAFSFDDTIEHEAWNDSDEMRVVLILDTWNPHLRPEERKMLSGLFTAMAASGVQQAPGVE